MARIPLYDQQRLRSSVVGTPGADFSSARALSQAGQQIQNLTTQTAFALAASKQRTEAVRKAQQAQLDKIDVANHLYTFQTSIGQTENELKAVNAQTPDQVPDLMQAQFGQSLQDYINANPMNESVRNTFTQKVLGSQTQRVQGLQNWSYAEQTKLAAGKMSNILDTAALQATDAQSLDQVLAGYDELDQQYADEFALAFGPKNTEVIHKSKQQAIENHLNGLALSENYELMKQELDDPRVRQTLGGDKTSQLKREWQTYINGQEREKREQQAFERTNSIIEINREVQEFLREGEPITPEYADTQSERLMEQGATPGQINKLQALVTRNMKAEEKATSKAALSNARNRVTRELENVRSKYQGINTKVLNLFNDDKVEEAIAVYRDMYTDFTLLSADAELSTGKVDKTINQQRDRLMKYYHVITQPAGKGSKAKRAKAAFDSFLSYEQAMMRDTEFSPVPAENRFYQAAYWDYVTDDYLSAVQQGLDTSNNTFRIKVQANALRQVQNMINSRRGVDQNGR